MIENKPYCQKRVSKSSSKTLQMHYTDFEDDMSDHHETSLKCGNASLSSLASEKDHSPNKSASAILSFDAYGNLTSSDDPDAPYTHEFTSLAECDYILNSFENRIPKDSESSTKKSKKNGAIKKSRSKKIKYDLGSNEPTSLSDTDLKQAFKKNFDTSALSITSRYGRTRKQKADDGFLFGTINFNELRKITSTSPKKNRHSSSEGKSDSETNLSEDIHSQISKDFKPISDKIVGYSSEEEFIDDSKNKKSKKKPIISPKIKSSPSDEKKLKSKHKEKKSVKNKKKAENLGNAACYFIKNEAIDNMNKIDQSDLESSSQNILSTDSQSDQLDTELHTENAEDIKKVKTEDSKKLVKMPDFNLQDIESIDDDVNIIKSSLVVSASTSQRKLCKVNDSDESHLFEGSLKLKSQTKTAKIEKSSKTDDEPEILKMETLNDEIKSEESVKTKYGRHVKKTILHDASLLKGIKKEVLDKETPAVIKEELLDMESSQNVLEIEKEYPCLYFIGDLVWVNIKGSPLWPGMITYPRNETNFTRFKQNATTLKFKGPRKYHVQFFYDNHQTMWVSATYVVPYAGLPNLLSYIEEAKLKVKSVKCSSKCLLEKNMLKAFSRMSNLLLTFKANNSKSLQWYKALEEADQALNMERYNRIQEFKAPQITETKKRKFSKNVPPASPKTGPPKICVKSLVSASESKNIKSETSSTKSKSSDDFSGFDDDSSIEKRKIKRIKLEKKLMVGDFEVYLQKHLESTMEETDMPKEKVKKLLQVKWNKLTPAQKLRYKSKLSHARFSSGDTDDSSSDLSSIASSKSKKSVTSEEDIHDPAKGTYKVPKNEKVCATCETVSSKSASDIVKCKGVCGSYFHLSCIGLDAVPSAEFKCTDCLSGTHTCFICKSSEGDPHKCSVTFCGKFYHDDCIKTWPQASKSNKSRQIEKFICPRHVCHTCAANADDMNDAAARTPPYTRCIRCPTTYHTGETCIAAGAEDISQNYHICTKHLKHSKFSNHHFNVNWCFCCSKGGSLLLCDQCPAAFHAECLNITAPEGGYVCEDCVNGKFPVYGDIVWVKLGQYRWWPGEVLHPRFIPDNIENLHHDQGMFCVHFFGSDDYYWLSRGRTFHYQEGDQGSKSSASKLFEQKFQKALDEAVVAYRKQKVKREKQEQNRSIKGNMKPPPYVKIDTNRPVGNVRLGKLDPSTITKCDCDPYSENPCGTDDKCINRMLMVECIREVCAGKERCNNQRFQRRQYPNVFAFKTSGRGWGLKTKSFIKKGAFVIEYVGELIDEAEFRRRIDEMHDKKEQNYYFLTVETDRMIDAGPKGNLARFMNHSCQPNCETQKWTVGADTRVGLFALEDIPEGSELTFNYNLECVGTEKKKCNCGAPNCSGFIGVKVQKMQHEVPGGLKKAENGIKKKKKGRKRKTEKSTENECFRCGYEGDLILCDVTTCPKGYHLDCLGLKELPKGKWICPWHHCDDCGTRALNKCIMCPNSYCRVHTNDKFHPTPELGNVCMEHYNEDKEAGSDESGNENSSSREHSPEVPT